MRVHGLESIAAETALEGYFVKCIVNRTDAVFFSAMIQHRDMKQEGVSYEDDYEGNALASVIRPGKVEVRFHKEYSDDEVGRIFREILLLPEMQWASAFSVEYQGRTLI